MDVSSIGPGTPVTRLQGSKAISNTNVGTTDRPATGDTVQISSTAHYLAAIKTMPPIRQAKVNAAKVAIAAGAYSAPHVIEGTITKLMQQL